MHKRTLRRHGHPEQTGVTAYELKPYRAAISARRSRNQSNPAWALLEHRWDALTAHAEETLERHATGTPGVAYERQAAEQLLTLRDGASSQDVIDTALAMFVLSEQRPYRFKSDRAFAFQLSRRVRGLAEVNAGKHLDPTTGRVKRTYKDVPPAVLARLAELLKSAFGVAGLRLAELELRDLRAAQAEKAVLHDALREMT